MGMELLSQDFCEDDNHPLGHCDTCGKPVRFWELEDQNIPSSSLAATGRRIFGLGIALLLLAGYTTITLSFISAWPNGPLTINVLSFSVATKAFTPRDGPTAFPLFLLIVFSSYFWWRMLIHVGNICYRIVRYSPLYAPVYAQYRKLLRTQQPTSPEGSRFER